MGEQTEENDRESQKERETDRKGEIGRQEE